VVVEKSTVIKVEVREGDKLSVAKDIVSLLSRIKGWRLSETQIEVIGYFMLYGISRKTKGLIIDSGVCNRMQSISDMLVGFKKKGIVYRDDLSEKLCLNKPLDVKMTNDLMLMIRVKVV
jgi:hypothetical protein